MNVRICAWLIYIWIKKGVDKRFAYQQVYASFEQLRSGFEPPARFMAHYGSSCSYTDNILKQNSDLFESETTSSKTNWSKDYAGKFLVRFCTHSQVRFSPRWSGGIMADKWRLLMLNWTTVHWALDYHAFMRKFGTSSNLFGLGTQSLATLAPVSGSFAATFVLWHGADLRTRSSILAGLPTTNIIRSAL